VQRTSIDPPCAFAIGTHRFGTRAIGVHADEGIGARLVAFDGCEGLLDQVNRADASLPPRGPRAFQSHAQDCIKDKRGPRLIYDLRVSEAVLAAVMTAPHAPVVIREFAEPDLPMGGALLRTARSEVCGTDVHLWHGRLSGVPYPIIPAM
jgi:hypothetical protein